MIFSKSRWKNLLRRRTGFPRHSRDEIQFGKDFSKFIPLENRLLSTQKASKTGTSALRRLYDVSTPNEAKEKGIRSRGTLRVVGIADTTVAPHLVPSCSAPPLPDVPSVRGSYCGVPQAALPSKRPPDVSSGAPERGSECVPHSSHPLPLPARVSDAHASVKTEAAGKCAPAIKISRKIRKYKNAGNGIEPDFCKNARTKNLKIPIPFECKIRYHKVRKPDDTKCRKKPELKMPLRPAVTALYGIKALYDIKALYGIKSATLCLY